MATTRATSWLIKRVEEIAGRGLVKLGKWCEARQKQHRTLLVRVQKMIVGVTLAEKEERATGRVMQKTLLGYDPEKAGQGQCRDTGRRATRGGVPKV